VANSVEFVTKPLRLDTASLPVAFFELWIYLPQLPLIASGIPWSNCRTLRRRVQGGRACSAWCVVPGGSERDSLAFLPQGRDRASSVPARPTITAEFVGFAGDHGPDRGSRTAHRGLRVLGASTVPSPSATIGTWWITRCDNW